MKSEIVHLIGSFLVLVLVSSCNYQSDFFHEYERKMKIGDQSEWKEKSFVDEQWENYPDEVPPGEIVWTRLKIRITEAQSTTYDKLGIMAVGSGAQEVFWDGVMIGKNGRLQTATKPEISGQYHKYYVIPDSLNEHGEHLLAVRLTAVYDTSPGVFAFVGDYQKLLTTPLHIVKYLFLIAGAFLMAAIYFFFLFYQQPKEYSVFIFGIICLLFFTLILMEYLKYYYAYPYEFQRTRLDVIGYLHNSIALLIPLYFMIQFSIPWKKVITGIIILGIIGIEYYYDYSYDYSAWANDRMMWGVSILLVAYAVYKKEKGALIILIGLIISALLPSFPFFYDVPFVSAFDISLFIGFVMILLLMFYLLTLKRSEERKAYEVSLVKSERLKNELLKKNIRPHFIMNTLTSLIDWVEESPKEGVQFIHALAGEFEVLNQIADYKLIPINQEIKLCKNHLRVMRFRKEINYRWEEEGIDPNEIIPPAIIHTAVENGITHSLPDDAGNILFRLIYNNTPTSKEYCLQTHAKNRPLELEQFTNLKDGTGSKYIKARLKESYGDSWQLESEKRDYGWEMRILLFK